MENLNLNEINFDMFRILLVEYGARVLGAILVLIVGWRIIAMIRRAMTRVMDKREIDPSLKSFLRGLFVNLLRIMLIISILGMVGIEMTSFIAVIGAAGLAIGLALSGTLQNFAGGVIILLLKPFKVGDFVEAQGYAGTVKEIQIFNTILKTIDNKTVIIPNGVLATGSMINFSTEPMRRVDWTFGIAYGDNASKARDLLLDLMKSDERIVAEPEPFVAISALADSSVNFTVRAWVKSADYWTVFFEMNQKVYEAFPQNGLNIPFPQMDVHLSQQK
ncbi:MAG: mechanosensitive ion channel [Bacteroidales bacterium]|nr:mechanosensitive ion channel [Bacteroidales bacterium]